MRDGSPSALGSALDVAPSFHLLFVLCALLKALPGPPNQIMRFAVARPQGIGRALLRRCVWLSRQEQSIGAVYLHVITTNPPAHRFYESEGFVQVCCISGEETKPRVVGRMLVLAYFVR